MHDEQNCAAVLHACMFLENFWVELGLLGFAWPFLNVVGEGESASCFLWELIPVRILPLGRRIT